MPVPSGNLALFNKIAGPGLSVSTVTALGGAYAKYENDFVTIADQKWAATGSETNITSASSVITPNYYDRAEIYYTWYERTGNETYYDRATALALDYRRDYIDVNNYEHLRTSFHLWEMQVEGLALAYLATGDEAYRTAVGKIADACAAQWWMDRIGNPSTTEIDVRAQAKVLDAFLYAKLINAPSTGISGSTIVGGHNWDTYLHTALDKILSTQSAAGEWRVQSSEGDKPFMNGMLNNTLSDYYRLYEQDPRIVTAVKADADYMWANFWLSGSQSFKYSEYDSTPSPDLNNLISQNYAWVYHMTGDAAYKTKAEAIFVSGVNNANLSGDKQFNQEYTSSYETVTWTHTAADGSLDLGGGGTTNQPPSIVGGDIATYAIPENSTAVATLAATDPENQAISWSLIGGADQLRFTINSSGTLAFATAPNFESPADSGANNVYDVTVQASDGNGGTDTQAIAVTVTDVAEAANTPPTITSNGGGATAAVSVPENSTAVTTVTATDPDAGQTKTFSLLSGGDAIKFAINASTGILTFVTAPNYEVPGDVGANNIYDVTVQVDDGAGGIDTQALAVTVTDVSEGTFNTINGTSGADNIQGTVGADLINGLAGNDTLAGLEGVDTIYGGDGDDLVSGNDGNDELHGDNGNDQLFGHAGTDQLFGELGNDLFVFDLPSRVGIGATRDVIRDWGAVTGNDDKIDMHLMDANTGLKNDQAFTWVGAGAFTGAAGQLRYVQSGGNTIVQGTVNADTIVDFEIQINGLFALTAADFSL